MKPAILNVFVATACAATLTACSGGGSDTTAEAFVSRADLPESGTVALSGEAVTAQYTRNTNSGSISVGSTSSLRSSTLNATFANGDQVATSASVAGSAFSVDTRRDGEVSVGQHLAVLSSVRDGSVAIFSNPDTAGLDHMAYGAWLDVDTAGSGSVSAGVYGAKTGSSDMPTSGSARYTGHSVGIAELNDGNLYATESDITISTNNFSSVSISSSNTITTALTGSNGSRYARNLDFSGTGTITDAEFSAYVTGSSVQGTANGNFYGPNASEVGGTFDLGGNNYDYIGAFGAD